MQLNCSVENVYPKNIVFIWQCCDFGKFVCDSKNDTMWKQINEDHVIIKTLKLFSSLVLEDQPQEKMFYRCQAKNFLGSDQILYKILKFQGNQTVHICLPAWQKMIFAYRQKIFIHFSKTTCFENSMVSQLDQIAVINSMCL